jgi:hypothetical protein
VKVIQQRTTHIGRNKQVTLVGEGILTEDDPANRRLGSHPEDQ